MTFPPNTTALDADVDMTRVHAQLVAQGFDTIIRYASHSWKGIKVAEAKSMAERLSQPANNKFPNIPNLTSAPSGAR